MKRILSRRVVLGSMAAAGGFSLLGLGVRGFPFPIRNPRDAGEALAWRGQEMLLASQPLVREYASDQISREFPVNGTMPSHERYRRLLERGFRDWALRVDGLVARPLSLSLPQLRALPLRSQITQHNCDEGWSAIGQWTGVPLRHILAMAGLRPQARYVVFHCMDVMDVDKRPYYESLDLLNATHPQTILAHAMNGQALAPEHGAPLRLRVELQIGYKNAKWLDRIEVTDSLNRYGKGRGGWWEDFDNAPWFAGQ
ncbi:molybdopterin-dependent oxidoreductase [Rhizorhabdus wittichii]|uniref:molybdopterin-dependent oxidoreductase n=1 Tax=Rhizorhabdus wittichii TaxID=160791 RepID=UPI0002F857F9|nr:molybdopterin-dependent oxidoreductase [Rhizorhabdus wittichii]